MESELWLQAIQGVSRQQTAGEVTFHSTTRVQPPKSQHYIVGVKVGENMEAFFDEPINIRLNTVHKL